MIDKKLPESLEIKAQRIRAQITMEDENGIGHPKGEGAVNEGDGVSAIDKLDHGVPCQGISAVPGDMLERILTPLVKVNVMTHSFMPCGIPPFVRIYSVSGEVVDMVLKKGNHIPRKGKHRLFVDEAVAEKPPVFSVGWKQA